MFLTAGNIHSYSFQEAGFRMQLEKYIMTEQQLRDYGFPRPRTDGSHKAKFYSSNDQDAKENERICRRCNTKYHVTADGTSVNMEECVYHPFNACKKKVKRSFQILYGCCDQKPGTTGCQTYPTHVNDKNKHSENGFVTTLPAPESDPRNGRVFSIDSEMVYTKAGLEPAQVTLIGENRQVVYESLIKPGAEILDYNTRFSGITARDMRGVKTSLRDVQDMLLSMISSKTILLGHSLEHDFKALKLIHSSVVDTCVVFPHSDGFPKRRALRYLVRDYLRKTIQAEEHDSKEDAVCCMELMMYKMKL